MRHAATKSHAPTKSDGAAMNHIKAADATLRQLDDPDIEILGIVCEWDDTPYRIGDADIVLRRITGVICRDGCDSEIVYDGIVVDETTFENTS
jgi:hypothetical protein